MAKHNILIVDDTPMMLRTLGDMLKVEYHILISKSGQQAIASAKKNKPSLILMDIMMPGMTGFEAMEILQEDEDTKNIPVIFVSGDVSRETKETAYKLGAVDFIEKPFIELAIKRRIGFIIEFLEMKSRLDRMSNTCESSPESSQRPPSKSVL